MNYIEDRNLLGETQGAFRKDRRVEDHVFTLHGLCSLRKTKKEQKILAFLDLSFAFDKVWRDGLFLSSLAKWWNYYVLFIKM